MHKPRIIIWGHKPFTHTHAPIHWGFYRAFQYLGYETYWMDDKDDVSNFNFSNCLFLTEGQVCQRMPQQKDCQYVLHNCPPMNVKFLNIQYITYESWKFEQVSHGITHKDDCLYTAWGSPLLPHEFNKEDVDKPRGSNIYYLGTVNGPNENGNYQNILKFAMAADKDGHQMHVGGGYTGATPTPYLNYIKGWISEEDQASYLRKSFMAPSIQGQNTLINGMIPCRLFKSVSYGNMCITNNQLAHEFFNGHTIYNDDCEELYWAAKAHADETPKKRVLMEFIKVNHTYINTINAIMSVL
jgi:hypothetical protein